MKLKCLIALVGIIVAIAVIKHMHMSHEKSLSPVARATKWMGGYGK